jgi:hypothetical protein
MPINELDVFRASLKQSVSVKSIAEKMEVGKDLRAAIRLFYKVWSGLTKFVKS